MRSDPEILRQCWFIAGPTACGKTALSLELAKRIGAEILAMDSMSIYRGMNIGTAKATPAERSCVPHHLLDLVDPHEEFSVSDFVSQAESVCRKLLERGRTPLFVGGTGLYLRAVLRGVFDGPPADWGLRNELESAAERHEGNWLHQQLQIVDPTTADRLHPNDRRRIIRALEVHTLTGRPLSGWQQQEPLSADECPKTVFWLSPPREWLHKRIHLRVDQMVAKGLIDEVRTLLDAEMPPGRTARQALGYREVIDYLEGRTSLPEAVDLIKTRTRQFAKRQYTWFRNLEECREIKTGTDDTIDELIQRLLSAAG